MYLHEDVSPCGMKSPYCFNTNARGGASYQHDFVSHLVDESFIMDDLESGWTSITLALRGFMGCCVEICYGSQFFLYKPK